MYELLVGIPPFYNRNQSAMLQQVLTKSLYFPDPARHRISMSDEVKDFITKLLTKDPAGRLGTQGSEEVLSHPWLASISKEDVLICDKRNPLPSHLIAQSLRIDAGISNIKCPP